MWAPNSFSDTIQGSTFLKCKAIYKCLYSYLIIGLAAGNYEYAQQCAKHYVSSFSFNPYNKPLR